MIPVKPEPFDRVIQVDHVTKSWVPLDDHASGFADSGTIMTSIISTDGALYQINDENSRKHSAYFEAKLHERVGVSPGDLLKLHGHGDCTYKDGWDIVKMK